MPNIKSAAKRVRQSEKRRIRNKAYITRMKNIIKKVIGAIEEKKPKEEVENLLREAFSVIDRVAQKGVIHKNQAARRKSRLHKKVKKYFEELEKSA